jgi:hypothetical protein
VLIVNRTFIIAITVLTVKWCLALLLGYIGFRIPQKPTVLPPAAGVELMPSKRKSTCASPDE